MARPFARSGEKSALAGLRLGRLCGFILLTLYITMVRTFKVVVHPLVVSAVLLANLFRQPKELTNTMRTGRS